MLSRLRRGVELDSEGDSRQENEEGDVPPARRRQDHLRQVAERRTRPSHKRRSRPASLPSVRATRRAWALLPGAIAATVGTWAWTTGAWGRLGVPLPSDGVTYGDLRVIPNAAACAALQADWSLSSPPCDPAMSYYNYPSIWARGLAIFGADDQWTQPLALALILMMAVSTSTLAAIAMRPGSEPRIALGLSIAAITPPMLLAGARGNVDQLIVVLLVLASALYISRRRALSAVVLALATGLKLFPVGAAITLFRDWGQRRLPMLIFVSLSALALIPLATELNVIQSRTPTLDGASFGSGLPFMALGAVLGSPIPVLAARVIGLAVFITTVAIAMWLLRSGRLGWLSNTSTRLADDRTASVLLLTGTGPFLVAYLAGPSFDYRLLLLLLPLTALLRLGSASVSIAVLATMMLSYSTFIGRAEYLGDVLLLALAPILALLCWSAVTGKRLGRTPEGSRLAS